MKKSEFELIEQQREHFNSISDEYKTARKNKKHLRLKELIWTDAFRNITFPNRRPLKVLEAMCGFAEGERVIRQYTQIDYEYHGFDYSDQVVQDMNSQHPHLKVWQDDATKWDPNNGKFDIIILIGGLHHIPNAAKNTTSLLTDSLVDGGLFINFEPTHANPLTKKVRQRIYEKNPLFDEETERDFSVEELTDMFKGAELNEVDTLYPGLLSYVLFYNPDAFPWLVKLPAFMVNWAFAFDRLIHRTKLGKFLSFATLSIWKK